MLENLDDTLATATTRRTIVKTGAKLAYVAPLVAVSFQVSQRGVGAVTPGGACGHSVGGISGGGCMAACTSTGCTGEACDGCDAPNPEGDPCEACCSNIHPELGKGNPCPSEKYCDPACFACVGGEAIFDPTAC